MASLDLFLYFPEPLRETPVNSLRLACWGAARFKGEHPPCPDAIPPEVWKLLPPPVRLYWLVIKEGNEERIDWLHEIVS